MFIRRLGAFFLDVLEIIVFAIGIFFFVYLLIMRPHKIKGLSMHPNYPDGEYLLTEKVSYYLHKPVRGDVVVFKPPVSEEDEYIKRIIGFPGETVLLKDGKVYINDNLLNEPYIADNVYTSGQGFISDGVAFTIPEGEYFVMGDNRPHSSDSRAWGPIKPKVITGRAWLVYWPLKSAGIAPKYNYKI
ncbi:signal peptidase I [Patescibacteria group bacterium]